MFNSKLKLQGLNLEEIIREGIQGNNPEMTIDDWRFIEYLYDNESNIIVERGTYTKEDLDETADCNYSQGLSDGGADSQEIKKLQTILEENNIEY